MTIQPRSVSLPGESTFMGKDSFLFRGFGNRWNATARNGQFETGNLEESLNSQRLFIRLIASSTRFFSLSPGLSPTAHSARTEAQRFTSAFGRTTKVNFTLFTSNYAIPRINVRKRHSEGIW